MGESAIDLQRGGIAVLGADGKVLWIDEAWAAKDAEDGIPRIPIGANLLEKYRGYSDPITQAIASAIVAIFEGKAMYFEIEHRGNRGGERSRVTSLAALRGEGAGAVLIHTVLGERAQFHATRSVEVTRSDGGSVDDGFDRLTPREREVLELMSVGLDNRAIAAKLDIQYTTVRGHVRSVIEKIGARSRLEAVARAYQKGLVPI